jgi:O-antigen ligase
LSSATLTATPRAPHVPAVLAGPAFWPIVIGAPVLTAVATMYSVQLGCSVALYVLVVGIHARSRNAGLVALWALWLLVPAVRRLIAMHGGYLNADPLAAVPFVTTATIAAIELWRGPVSRRALHIMGAALAGYLIGVPAGLSAPSALAFGLLAYVSALLSFGLGYRETLNSPTLPRVLLWTMPALSAYAILQYFLPLPRWDRVWLKTVDFITATAPEDGKIRVWSTLNSPNTFAWMLGLTILTYLVARRFTPARAVGLVLALTALALTYVRSSWVALAAALIALVLVSRGRATPRVTLVLIVIFVGVPVIAAGTGTGDALVKRFSTLGSLGQDQSANDRVATPQTLAPVAAQAPLGYGIGIAGEATRLDSGKAGLRASDNAYLALLLQVGPVGALLVLGAAGAAMRNAWSNARRSARPADVLIVVMLAFLVTQMAAGDALYGITGIVFWYLLGMAVARSESNAHQEALPA